MRRKNKTSYSRKLKPLSADEVKDRAMLCMENDLCFITKNPLGDSTAMVHHPEAGYVFINTIRPE